MRLLCTPPIKDNWELELSRFGATVTTFEWDGTFLDEDGDTWDGAFITPESFKLFHEGGRPALSKLYDALAAIVRAGRVGWVHICAAGLDVPIFYSLMHACHTSGTTISHCPGVYATPIAQYCLGHFLSISRMMPLHATNQAERKYQSLLQRDLRTCTVGIVGAGGIGAEVARLSKAFGMGTIGWRRNAAPAEDFDEVTSGAEGLSRLLAHSDFVVVAVPSTPATQGLIGAAQLAMMKPTAWLVNVARGSVLDEPALAEALAAEGKAPAGAVLDVFAVEPLPGGSPLWSLPNVVITPHDSWRTDAALKDNHRYFVDNARRRKAGEQLQGLVAEEYMAPAIAAVEAEAAQPAASSQAQPAAA